MRVLRSRSWLYSKLPFELRNSLGSIRQPWKNRRLWGSHAGSNSHLSENSGMPLHPPSWTSNVHQVEHLINVCCCGLCSGPYLFWISHVWMVFTLWHSSFFVTSNITLYLAPFTKYEFKLSANTSKGYGVSYNGTFSTDESGMFLLLDVF